MYLSPELEILWSQDSSHVTFPLQTSGYEGGGEPIRYARYTFNIPETALGLLKIEPFSDVRTKHRIAFSRDGIWLVSMYPSGHKSGLRIFNTRSGDLVRAVHHLCFNGISFSASADEEAHFFLEDGVLACKLSSRFRLTSARCTIRESSVSSPDSGSTMDAPVVCDGAAGPFPWHYDASSRELIWYMAEADPGITTADFWLSDEGDGPVLVGIGWSDGWVDVFDGRTGVSVVASRTEDGLEISHVLFAPDGKTMWYVHGDKQIFPLEVPHS